MTHFIALCEQIERNAAKRCDGKTRYKALSLLIGRRVYAELAKSKSQNVRAMAQTALTEVEAEMVQFVRAN